MTTIEDWQNEEYINNQKIIQDTILKLNNAEIKTTCKSYIFPLPNNNNIIPIDLVELTIINGEWKQKTK